MVQAWILTDAIERSYRSSFWIVAAIDDARDSRVDERASGHRAWLEGDDRDGGPGRAEEARGASGRRTRRDILLAW